MNNILKGSVLFMITLLMVGVMNKTGKPLKITESPYGIINFELAMTTGEVSVIKQAWNTKELINVAKKNTYFDFIFIGAYAALFFFLCRQLSIHFRRNNIISKISAFFSYAILWAGLLDILENTGMLISLSGHVTTTVVIVTFISSILKWVLVSGCIAWLLVAGIIWLTQLFKRKGKIDSAFAK